MGAGMGNLARPTKRRNSIPSIRRAATSRLQRVQNRGESHYSVCGTGRSALVCECRGRRGIAARTGTPLAPFSGRPRAAAAEAVPEPGLHIRGGAGLDDEAQMNTSPANGSERKTRGAVGNLADFFGDLLTLIELQGLLVLVDAGEEFRKARKALLLLVL